MYNDYLESHFNLRAGGRSREHVAPTGLRVEGAGEEAVLAWDASLDDLRQADVDDSLLRFQALADQTPEQIRDFAERYGLLGICGHRDKFGQWLAPTDPETCKECVGSKGINEALARALAQGDTIRIWGAIWKARRHQELAGASPLSPDDLLGRVGVIREPIAAWRQYSSEVRSILRATVCLQDEKPLREDDVVVLTGLAGPMLPDLGVGSFAEDAVQAWFRTRGRLSMRLEWDRRERRFGGHPEGVGLRGTIAAQLAAWLVSDRRAYPCTNCGSLHQPAKAPSSGKPTYCRLCRRAYQTRKQREYRHRARNAESGTSL